MSHGPAAFQEAEKHTSTRAPEHTPEHVYADTPTRPQRNERKGGLRRLNYAAAAAEYRGAGRAGSRMLARCRRLGAAQVPGFLGFEITCIWMDLCSLESMRVVKCTRA